MYVYVLVYCNFYLHATHILINENDICICEVVDFTENTQQNVYAKILQKKKKKSKKTNVQCSSQHWQKTRKYVHNWPHTCVHQITHTPGNWPHTCVHQITHTPGKKKAVRKMRWEWNTRLMSPCGYTHTHTHRRGTPTTKTTHREHMQMILEESYIGGRNFGPDDSSSEGKLDTTSWLPWRIMGMKPLVPTPSTTILVLFKIPFPLYKSVGGGLDLISTLATREAVACFGSHMAVLVAVSTGDSESLFPFCKGGGRTERVVVGVMWTDLGSPFDCKPW